MSEIACKPPEGTPEGTICDLVRFGSGGKSWTWKWTNGGFRVYPEDPRDRIMSPHEMAINGWMFKGITK